MTKIFVGKMLGLDDCDYEQAEVGILFSDLDALCKTAEVLISQNINLKVDFKTKYLFLPGEVLSEGNK